MREFKVIKSKDNDIMQKIVTLIIYIIYRVKNSTYNLTTIYWFFEIEVQSILANT